MITKTFAPWVEPYARQLRENRAGVVAFARSVPAESWEKPSPLDGWTYKDILAHIGKGNDQLFQKLLRMVVAGEAVDTSIFAEVDTDGENARGVEERRRMSAEELIVELEESGEEIQELLCHVTADQQHLRQEEPLFLLEGFLQGVCKESHDIEHLTQLRTAVEATHTFAMWVEPIAAQLRETRGEIVEIAHSIPAEAWSRPSPNEGWTYQELLAHLASGDWVCQIILRAAVANEQADLSILDQLDATNARLLEERAGRSTDELIAEVEAESYETQDLLNRLADEDDQRTQEGAPMSLGEYLRMFPDHDRGHLADLRTAVEAR